MRTISHMAVGGLLAFAAIVVVQHALEPQLGPSRHTISEYANADAGALMVVGFLAWSVSLLSTAWLVWSQRRAGRHPAAGSALAILLAVAAVGLLLTACFSTQTSAGVLPPGTRYDAAGRIHDLASGVALCALSGAVVASVAWLSDRVLFARLTGALLAASVVAAGVLLAIGDPVDGIRQRVLLTTACAWQLALALTVARRVSGS